MEDNRFITTDDDEGDYSLTIEEDEINNENEDIVMMEGNIHTNQINIYAPQKEYERNRQIELRNRELNSIVEAMIKKAVFLLNPVYNNKQVMLIFKPVSNLQPFVQVNLQNPNRGGILLTAFNVIVDRSWPFGLNTLRDFMIKELTVLLGNPSRLDRINDGDYRVDSVIIDVINSNINTLVYSRNVDNYIYKVNINSNFRTLMMLNLIRLYSNRNIILNDKTHTLTSLYVQMAERIAAFKNIPFNRKDVQKNKIKCRFKLEHSTFQSRQTGLHTLNSGPIASRPYSANLSIIFYINDKEAVLNPQSIALISIVLDVLLTTLAVAPTILTSIPSNNSITVIDARRTNVKK